MMYTTESITDILQRAEFATDKVKFDLIWGMLAWIEDDEYYESSKFWVMHWLQNTEEDVREYCVDNILHNMKEYSDE